MKHWLLAGFLLMQNPFDAEMTLEQERRATQRSPSPHALVTIIVTFEDGRPLRGHIQCSGWWMKHRDEDDEGFVHHLPFKTDSRGAIIMNPNLTDEWLTCWAEQNGKSGTGTIEFSEDSPSGILRITLK